MLCMPRTWVCDDTSLQSTLALVTEKGQCFGDTASRSLGMINDSTWAEHSHSISPPSLSPPFVDATFIKVNKDETPPLHVNALKVRHDLLVLRPVPSTFQFCWHRIEDCNEHSITASFRTKWTNITVASHDQMRTGNKAAPEKELCHCPTPENNWQIQMCLISCTKVIFSHNMMLVYHETVNIWSKKV